VENTEKTSQKLPKNEKVKSKKIVEALFSSKVQSFEYPFKIFSLFADDAQSSPQILISIPKRNFKKAVDRNRLRRQIREIYRINKKLIKPPAPLAIAIILVSKEKIEFPMLQKKLIGILSRLKKTV
jgi:ribonuclease P protein component